ncbi:MAG: hypothetical protein Q9225_001396 [Loekoesia sp. 1 TL-2023]
MRTVNCEGDPYEIGFKHGFEAKAEILRGIIFYKQFLFQTTKQAWFEACEVAEKFLPVLQRRFPDYLTEIRVWLMLSECMILDCWSSWESSYETDMLTVEIGLAAGADVPFSSILTLNVRTEIAFGMFLDGSTALSWKNSDTSFLAQNWDWRQEQKDNLIRLRIERNDKPSIDMITEAGIIGKIGLNSAGVGVCLNAIRARGVDFDKLPCHLALRRCLDSTSQEDAVAALQHAGVASPCHILVADSCGGSGLECSSADIVVLSMSSQELIVHTNHYIGRHPGVEENVHIEDSYARLARIQELMKSAKAELGSIQKLLEDEDGYPTAINRQRTDDSTIATMFSIVMDLKGRSATVQVGRPSAADETLDLQPHVPNIN